MAAFCNYFSRFQPDVPEPLQNAWFYLDSCDIMRFCSQWFFLLTLPRFSLISQNPSRIYDFTWIPVILCDFVGNVCFCLLFQVSSAGNCWQVLLHCYFLLFPTISWYFLLFHGISCYFLLPAISCYFLVFQLIPAISNYLLLFPSISKNFMLSPTIPYYFLRFLLFPMISC